MKVNTLRFAVGKKGDQLSPVWRIWNKGNDIYIVARQVGDIFKISLHASGVWTVASRSQSGIELKPGSRRMKTWHRPSETIEGWTLGSFITVPRLVKYDDFKVDEKPNKPVEWIRPPKKGQKVTLLTYIGKSGLTAADLGPVAAKGDVVIDEFLELDNGERVYILIRYEEVDATDLDIIRYFEQSASDWEQGTHLLLTSFMQGSEVPSVYNIKYGSKAA